MLSKKITEYLTKTNSTIFSIYAIVVSFSTYTCMYAFRKPFAVATFEGLSYWGMDYKTLLIISQVIGYTLSKFLGIKVISEMTSNRRIILLIIFIVIAEIALFLFSITPSPYNIFMLFLNGLPLGMIWGIVFSFLEGRKVTELLGAGLSVSFIFASGFVKSVGKMVIDYWGVTEFQMPFITGIIFFIPILFFSYLLSLIPPPTAEDEKLRTERVPMNSKDRKEFFKRFAYGIIVLTVIYMFLTAFRDLRDNYVANIWTDLGYTNTPMIFTATEIPITIIVLVVMGSLILIEENMRALLINHVIILFGIILIGLSTLLYQYDLISPILWIVLGGLGLYLGYVPFNCIIFDRFIATYKTAANAGFLIYIADSFGYLSSVGVLLYKNFSYSEVNWLDFFVDTSYTISFFGALLTIISILYFLNRRKNSVKSNANYIKQYEY